MKPILIKIIYLGAFVLALAATAPGQTNAKESHSDNDNIVESVLEGSGKVTFIVVKTAGKAAWGTTKFTAKHVAKPIGKAVLLKAAPEIAAFTLRSAGTAGRRLTPIAVKIALL
jgi:hypothetical protein